MVITVKFAAHWVELQLSGGYALRYLDGSLGIEGNPDFRDVIFDGGSFFAGCLAASAHESCSFYCICVWLTGYMAVWLYAVWLAVYLATWLSGSSTWLSSCLAVGLD
jgi:hypothetical protein